MTALHRLDRVANAVRDLAGWRLAALALVLGAAGMFALPPWYLLPLAIPAFAGLVWMIEGAAAGPRPLRRAFFAGLLFGLGHFAVGIWWVHEAFLIDAARTAWLIPFLVGGLAVVLAVFPAAAALAAAALWGRRPAPAVARICAFAGLWLLAEWLRSWLFTGFPWNLVGYAWTIDPAPLQFAAVAGVWGLSLVAVLAAAMPAALADSRARRAGLVATLAFTLLLPAAMWAGGAVRLGQAPDIAAGEHVVAGVRLRLVQAAIPQTLKWQDGLRRQHLQMHIDLSRQLPAAGAPSPTLVIWPETAVPYLLANDEGARRAVALAVPAGGLLIAGAARAGPDANGTRRWWNAVHAIAGDGDIVATYDKAHLVPMGEYVPLRSVLPIDTIVPGREDFAAGPGPQTLALPGLPAVGPLVCYEAIFPGAVAATPRPAWLVNLTNDAWFGTSVGPAQHFAIARTRAVEEGMPLVRAANTGISAIVDPWGRVLARLDLGTVGVLDAALPRALAPTPFAYMKNWVVVSLLLIVLIMYLFLFRYVSLTKN
ncbi:MAG: apolipoprotein N-acyltransferase [Alphaproteobacteria bacterium]|nr:apolipoprotein N-acyltransferase [Alphaproteobacteria bacterium]